MQLLGKLGIDWKILLAQIINFLILLWFLGKFLYKPILKNLEERAKRAKKIKEKEKEVQREKAEAQKREEEIVRKAKEKTKQIIEEGKEISKKEKERIINRAEEEVRQILKEARARAEVEVEKIKEAEKKEVLKKTEEVVKKALSASFTKELHEKFLKETMEELEKLDFNKISRREVIQVLVISAFPLSKEAEKTIADFLFSKLKNPAFQEKVDPELIAGIKVSMDGFLVDGSLKAKIEKAVYGK